MRIAIWHNLPSGGGKRALYDQAAGLLQRGHTVEAWCPSTAEIDYLPLNRLIPEHVLPLQWPEIQDRGFPWNPSLEHQTIIKKLQAMRDHCKVCAEKINNGGFDVLIAHSCGSFATSPIGHFVQIPKMLYLQEPYRRLYEAFPTLPWQALEQSENRNLRESLSEARKLLSNLFMVQGLRIQVREERKNAMSFQMILANSFYSRESILRAYGLDARLCYLGIDIEKFNYQGLSRDNFLVGLGVINTHKNIEFVIQAVALLPPPRPPLIWIANRAGKKYLIRMKELAETLNVDFQVKININDDELVKLLGSARLMVYAPRLEPFGYAPLEANACGTPVIAVSEGGIRETIIDGRNGILVENTPKAMAIAIEKLLANPKLAEQMGQEGRALVKEKWSIATSIQRLLDLIDEVTSSYKN